MYIQINIPINSHIQHIHKKNNFIYKSNIVKINPQNGIKTWQAALIL